MKNRIDLIFIKLSDYLSSEDYNFLSNYVTDLEALLYIYINNIKKQKKDIEDLRQYIDKLERGI